MADEPTWEDLFGQPGEPVKPQQPPVQPAPPVQQPVQPAPPAYGVPPIEQQPPVQPQPTYPPTQSYPPVAPQQPSFPQQQQPTPPQYQPAADPFQQAQQAQPVQPTQPLAPTTFAATEVGTRRSQRDGVPPGRGGRDSSRGGRNGGPKKRRRWLTVLIVLVVVFGFLGTGAGVVYAQFGPQIRNALHLNGPNDYKGTGNGKVVSYTILSGQTGDDIAKGLAKAGVTKTSIAFFDLLLKQKPAAVFEPGTYKLEQQMSSKSALAALTDPKNRIVSKVVIPEGMTLPQILTRISTGTGIPLADLQTEAKNYTQFGVPKSAPSLEGFLFPATYTFDPGTTAKAVLQEMVTTMNQHLKTAGVTSANELKVLTLASIIQKEGGSTKDFYKVSRVFTNRLNIGMHLQSDATVSYGAGSKTIETTAAQRADVNNKYNTYARAGLPIGPISAPGDAAINAALHPVAGPWLYFVLVNGYTGQTTFSTTVAGQDAAVRVWQAWLRAHPGYGQ